jgi:RimJ/RimL family protein N-acetyltransferase
VTVLLETPRLVLRQFTEADVSNLVELDSDPEVMRYLTGGVATPPEVVACERLPAILKHYRTFRGYGYWAAIDRSTDDFLGWFGLRPPSDDRRDEAELGYRLRRSAWGKGLATEGTRALIRKCFTEFGVERVFAHTMAVNTASRRVMEKAGLEYVRTFHEEFDDPIEGTEQGEVEYELRRRDWEAREA